jgi:hypothetical protein
MSRNNNFNGYGTRRILDETGENPSEKAKNVNRRMYKRAKQKAKEKQKLKEAYDEWERTEKDKWSIVKNDI